MANNVFDNIDFEESVAKRLRFIQEVYMYDEKPWVIGYSGGKDSTVITDLVIRAIEALPEEKRIKPIFIISSDTMVENPMIEEYIVKNMKIIDNYCKSKNLKISSHMIKPTLDDTFWVNLIGKGYPAPQQKFRWCTDRLKIKPANIFVKEKVNQYGEVVMVLGVRSSESSARSQVMENTKIEGKVLRKHSSLANALVFAPIEDYSTDDVWKYLMNKNPNAWDEDNAFLMGLYQDSQDGECPLMVDREKPSCGNSRFGCWSCTVVQQDKSLNGFIKTAKRNKDKKTLVKLVELSKLRNWLKENRNKEEYREFKRQNGAIYRIETKEGTKVGLGAYNFYGRQLILKKLLEAQKNSNLTLITKEELSYIQTEWNNRLGDLINSVNSVYKEVYKKDLFESKQAMIYKEEEIKLLETICKEEGVSEELVRRLLRVEQKYYGYSYKNNLYTKLDKILDQDWVHEEEIIDYKFGE